jgi:GNAT superfamily N-acetyltransferase
MRIRTARSDDEAQWRGLWRGYTEFYETHLPEHVTAATWRRIVAPRPAILCRIAEEQGRLLGFSHSLLHEGTFVQELICYLEDLFVDPSARGRGVGRALIADLVAMASHRGWSRLYWHTRRKSGGAAALRRFRAGRRLRALSPDHELTRDAASISPKLSRERP